MRGLRDIVSDLATLINKCLMPWLRQRYRPVFDDDDRGEPFTNMLDAKLTAIRDSHAFYGQQAAESVKQAQITQQSASMPSSPPAPPPMPPAPPPTPPSGGTPFDRQVERLATAKVKMAAAESTECVRKQINDAVGIDMGAMMTEARIVDYVDAAVAENVSLIKTVPARFFTSIERVVLDGYRSGKSLKHITQAIQGVYDASDYDAQRIARDQISKITSDVMRKRMLDNGIERFKWTTSQDERVSGNPAGRYPGAKIKCFRIARKDTGLGAGVYTLADGAKWADEDHLFPGRAHVNCRCTASPLFPGIDYTPWDE